MTQPDGVVAVITGLDLLRRLESMNDAMYQLAAKVDGIPITVADHETRITDHEGRLRGVERRIWAAAGGTGALSAVLAALVTYVVSRH